MSNYVRVPIGVDVRFFPEGKFVPVRIFFQDEYFEINRIFKVRKHCPQTVRSITPTEFTVMIEGVEKKIYYEEENESWFSIKEVKKNE